MHNWSLIWLRPSLKTRYNHFNWNHKDLFVANISSEPLNFSRKKAKKRIMFSRLRDGKKETLPLRPITPGPSSTTFRPRLPNKIFSLHFLLLVKGAAQLFPTSLIHDWLFGLFSLITIARIWQGRYGNTPIHYRAVKYISLMRRRLTFKDMTTYAQVKQLSACIF